VYRLKRNENIEDILEDFAVRSEAEDIQYFAAVFRYAKRCGGDLIGIIRKTAQMISEKAETMNEIQTVISGKKMEQRVMGVIPFCIIGYLRITSFDFIAPLYGNALGAVVMTGCLAIYVLAGYIAKRIVNIEIYQG
jgi:tight adherence protein B